MRALDVRQKRGEGVLKRIGDETLRRQVIKLVRVDLSDAGVNAGKALQTGGVKLDLVEDRRKPRKAMGRILQRRSPHQAVDLVALLQQQFGKVGAVLAGNAGDARAFHCRFSLAQAFTPGEERHRQFTFR